MILQVAEGLTTSALTLFQNLCCFLFLLVPQCFAATLGTAWMSWALVVAFLVALLILLPLREPRRRLAVDAATLNAGEPVVPAVVSGTLVAPGAS